MICHPGGGVGKHEGMLCSSPFPAENSLSVYFKPEANQEKNPCAQPLRWPQQHSAVVIYLVHTKLCTQGQDKWREGRW